MTDKIDIKNTGEYKQIYNSLKSDNDRVKTMQASKLYYAKYPDQRPYKAPKKQKVNLDSLIYL